MNEIAKNFVGGEWVQGAQVVDDINPSNTEEVVGRFVHADAAQAQAAIEAARDAFPAWSRSGSSYARARSWCRACGHALERQSDRRECSRHEDQSCRAE